jgi:hypothetical protein
VVSDELWLSRGPMTPALDSSTRYCGCRHSAQRTQVIIGDGGFGTMQARIPQPLARS